MCQNQNIGDAAPASQYQTCGQICGCMGCRYSIQRLPKENALKMANERAIQRFDMRARRPDRVEAQELRHIAVCAEFMGATEEGDGDVLVE